MTVLIVGIQCLLHQKTSVWTTYLRISWSYGCCWKPFQAKYTSLLSFQTLPSGLYARVIMDKNKHNRKFWWQNWRTRHNFYIKCKQKVTKCWRMMRRIWLKMIYLSVNIIQKVTKCWRMMRRIWLKNDIFISEYYTESDKMLTNDETNLIKNYIFISEYYTESDKILTNDETNLIKKWSIY